MSLGALGARLLSVFELVGQGAVFADIGTDHAHLPIALLKEGIIERAVCSDINKGPLDSAKRNAKEAGLEEKIDFVLTDGAADLADKGIDCYAVCGMGGELIADIIEAAPHLKSKEVTLILQPMTKQAHLRKYLYKNGFAILTESYSSEGNRHYVAMLVRYIDKPRNISDIEAEAGLKPLDYVNKTSQISYLEGKIKALTRMIEGKKQSADASLNDEVILFGLVETLNELKGR